VRHLLFLGRGVCVALYAGPCGARLLNRPLLECAQWIGSSRRWPASVLRSRCVALCSGPVLWTSPQCCTEPPCWSRCCAWARQRRTWQACRAPCFRGAAGTTASWATAARSPAPRHHVCVVSRPGTCRAAGPSCAGLGPHLHPPPSASFELPVVVARSRTSAKA
jgi:hypothetical protein